jgi:hypothetical protein
MNVLSFNREIVRSVRVPESLSRSSFEVEAIVSSVINEVEVVVFGSLISEAIE